MQELSEYVGQGVRVHLAQTGSLMTKSKCPPSKEDGMRVKVISTEEVLVVVQVRVKEVNAEGAIEG